MGVELAIVTSVLAIVGGLWRAFSVIEGIRRDAQANHSEMKVSIQQIHAKINVIEQALEHQKEVWEMGTHGVLERLEHTRSRLLVEVESQEGRIRDLEGFLNKSTEFVPRNY